MNLIAAIFMCSINILNAKLRTNYDKMKLVILLYNSVSLDRAMFLSEKRLISKKILLMASY